MVFAFEMRMEINDFFHCFFPNKGPLEIDVLESLNHGFLNFNIFCRRAQEGVDLCTHRIRQIMSSLRNDS